MHEVKGGCHCGNLKLLVKLTAAPETYNPRACDCNFCRQHGSAALSDPKGSLSIQVENSSNLSAYRQGSGQAEFLLCKMCGVMVAVLYRKEQRLYATVNAKALDRAVKFGAEQPVSPKTLSADEKANRWQSLWFPEVHPTFRTSRAAFPAIFSAPQARLFRGVELDQA